MSPDGLDQLRAKREQARERRTPPPPRHPRPPADDTPAGSEQAAFSASEKSAPPPPSAAVISASEKSGGEPGISASEKAGPAPMISASRKSGAPARRRGRPRGPRRYTLSVRITAELDIRLSRECEASGDGPQIIVERALDEYLSRRARQRSREAKSSG